MNNTDQPLDDLVRLFATRWERLGEPEVGEGLLADPVLVLGPEATVPVPRTEFLTAVSARADAVSAVSAPPTRLAGVTAQALGERMVVATITWSFGPPDGAVTLVSDFLLQREEPGSLRCVAYLPRTNVMDHLPRAGDR